MVGLSKLCDGGGGYVILYENNIDNYKTYEMNLYFHGKDTGVVSITMKYHVS